MNLPSIPVRYDPWVVLWSYAIASLAGHVALDLAKRVRTPDRQAARGWWAAGSLTLGSGIWAMHFVGMLALKLPFAVGYDHLVTALSWVAAVAVSAVALHIAGRHRLTVASLTTGALVMGGGICAMHYTGMAALALAPGIDWSWPLVLASAVVAVVASAVALLLFFGLRRLSGVRARVCQAAAALAVGAAITGMHYTGMAAAGFREGAVCLSADGLRGESLLELVSIAAIGLLGMTMAVSALDAHLRARAVRLSNSLRAATDELHRVGLRDALTGLPNRLVFDDRVAQAVQRSVREGGSLAVLFVNLDGFKPINDSFGRAAGDSLLCAMATRLAGEARAIDTVARVGGDEFVLLLDGRPDQAAAAQVAQRLIDTLSLPVAAGGRELRLSCSVGIALFPSDGPGDSLMTHADAAMQAAKRAGGACYAFFAPHMDADVREQLDLQRDLRLALARGGELALHYQPKLRADTGKLAGAEALVRWHHPVRGLLPPGLFIPVAERFGLIGALGEWVIDEACRQMRAWRDDGLTLCVAVNLSVHQLRQDDLAERVSRALQRHGIDPSTLTIEITESVAMDDGESGMQAFQRLRALGVQLSIDDFGTGHSSLSYLRRLQAGQLKIDRSFVQDVETSIDARAIVGAVVQLAHALRLDVVAEGVETDAQRQVLQTLGCDELQGYWFARPMPPAALPDWAAALASCDRPVAEADLPSI